MSNTRNTRNNQGQTFRNIKVVLLSGVFLTVFSFSVYLMTLPPSITSYGDSSELITKAYELEAAHPPGYPLFVMLGKLFTFIPYGSVAWRVHLSSAVYGSLSIFFIFLSLFLLTKNLTISTSCAILLGLSHSFWLYSIIAEVYALNNLIASLIVFNLLLWEKKVKEKIKNATGNLYLAFFFLGLGLSNHQSIILIAPAFFFFVLAIDRLILVKKIFKLPIFFTLGLLPYLHTIYSALQPHTPAYGNLPNIERFIAYLTRADYGGPLSPGALVSTPVTAPDFLYYFRFLGTQFSYLTFPVVLFGVWLIYKRAKWSSLFPFIFYFFTGIFLWLRIFKIVDLNDLHVMGVIERFLLFSFIPLTLCLGVSIREVLTINKVFLIRLQNPVVALLSCTLLATFLVKSNFSQVSKRNFFLAKNYALNILNQIEENAIILSTDDLTNSSLDYFIRVENIKPEVIVLSSAFLSNKAYQKEIQSHWPDLLITDSQYEYDIMRNIIKTNQEKRPLYFVMLDDPYPLGFNSNPYRFLPRGLLLLANSNLVMSEVQKEVQSTDWWQSYNLSGLDRLYKEPFAQLLVNSYAFRHRINALVFMEQLKIFSLARKEIDASLALNPQDEKAKDIRQKLETEYKEWADDFRPKQDVDYGLTSEEHLKRAQELMSTPSLIENFNLHQAVYEAELAINKDNNNATAHATLGLLYEAFECFRDASNEYQTALELEPENAEWKSSLLRVERKV